jgi:hypothetical protein
VNYNNGIEKEGRSKVDEFGRHKVVRQMHE